jgi:hypothetical protein
MNKEALKNLVKSYFQLEEKQTSNNEESKQQFDEATLVDGTKVTNMLEDAFAVGQELHVILEDGTHVVAPEGSHDTESGITLVVNAEGKITGVHRPESEGEGSLAEHTDDIVEEEMNAEEAPKTEMAEDGEEDLSEHLPEEEQMEIKELIIDSIMTEVAPAIEELKKKMAEHDTVIETIREEMKTYMSAPASEPTSESMYSKVEAKVRQPKAVFNKKRYETALSRLTNK